jgi:SAM-dependent methyltransferase
MTNNDNNFEEEYSEIRKRYNKRKTLTPPPIDKQIRFWANVHRERFEIYKKILLPTIHKDSLILEIGASCATNLNDFVKLGANKENIILNNLLDHYSLENIVPKKQIIIGDAATLDFPKRFDIILQSIVFSSILNNALRKELAQNMLRMLKPGGTILFYDFVYNNPFNKDVRKVTKKEISLLFNNAKTISFFSATLAPPIARLFGDMYNTLNSISLLRTHVVAEIKN